MKNINVLIVDDSELDRYILRRQLTGLGVEHIVEKDDGSSALDYLKDYDRNYQLFPGKFPPIIIFLDINMPKVNGFDFLDEFAKIRRQFDFRSCVVAMYSSSERTEDKERALKYEFVSRYLVKGEITESYLDETLQALNKSN
ncbi:Chemotaxis protein CheY [Paraglaciecola mesophila]|uniref:Chemotaxis protein CheY n=1 Tax=Paraglaciecola mesophila TaxID=197222 RepID=A0A857JP18_9ALTE|nr:response regulator [Paraglaciecola mesophila]QHJ13122.1 Chemotaxis protein CheY [Paraglaciecola mesophila]